MIERPEREAPALHEGRTLDGAARQRLLQLAERAFLIGGLVLLIGLVRELGTRQVADNLWLVGWGVLPIVLQELLAYVANTLGWLAAFPRPRPPIPFGRLLAARIVGDAVNYVTPTATLGGEFVRARFLRYQARTAPVVASVAVAKLSQTIGQITFVVVGLALILDEVPLPSGVRAGLLGGLAAVSVGAAVLLVAQRRGLFAPLLAVAQRMGLRQAPELLGRLRQLDAEIARAHGDAARTVVPSAACFFVGWVLGMVEGALLLWFLDVGVSVQRVLKIEVLSVAIDGMFFFVPLKLGTQEGGKVLIFTLLGLDPAKGLAYGILRRVRELTWAAIGLSLLSRQQLAMRAAAPLSESARPKPVAP